MTPNRAKITIVNPCSENWDSMQLDTVGRFCQSCQKSVIDFSSKSDDEIKSFLKDKHGEKLCGRFYIHQVARIRIEIDQTILISNIPFWQKFLAVLLVCFGTDFLGIDFAFAQTEPDSIPVKTEQIDSLLSTHSTIEADSALTLTTDSLQLKIPEVTTFEPQQICTLDAGIFVSGMMITGTTMIIDPDYFHPKPANPIILNGLNTDTVVPPQHETAVTSKKNPAFPKHPPKGTGTSGKCRYYRCF